ncbi:MAG: family 78 glycoside hydrolase catalytic domain, partial [Planctomycetes bacterium]|nr:family 78 glycoside hydrolase catalytic domain [Planctomycetota bacterium]
YEGEFNGEPLDDAVLKPASSNYRMLFDDLEDAGRFLYQAYDLSEKMDPGEHDLEFMLGHGWFSADTEEPTGRNAYHDRQILRVQLEIVYADGSQQSIVSDQNWQCAQAHIVSNDLAHGEVWDARRHIEWTQPQLNQSWNAAATELQCNPQGKRMQQITACSVRKTAERTFIIKMPVFLFGWAELSIRDTQANDEISLRFAGKSNGDQLNTDNTDFYMPADQKDTYICAGADNLMWRPHFTAHGFQFIEVTGPRYELTADDIAVYSINDDIARKSSFSCSDDSLNRLHEMAVRTLECSFQGIPQDAADRAERVGWLGDPGFVMDDYLCNFADHTFWIKWLEDILALQKEDGSVPYAAPAHGQVQEGSWAIWPAWQGNYFITVYKVLQYYGDKQQAAQHYPHLKKLLQYFTEHFEDGYIHVNEWGKSPLGDHMEPQADGSSAHFPKRTDNGFTNSIYVIYCIRIMQELASDLGFAEESAAYGKLLTETQTALHAAFYQAETGGSGVYDKASQSSHAFAIWQQLPQADQSFVDGFIKTIRDENYKIDTGVLGTAALIDALITSDEIETAYKMICSKG